jgi:hypothetical protein
VHVRNNDMRQTLYPKSSMHVSINPRDYLLPEPRKILMR